MLGSAIAYGGPAVRSCAYDWLGRLSDLSTEHNSNAAIDIHLNAMTKDGHGSGFENLT